MRYATWADRVIGYLIDALLIVGGMVFLNLILGTFVAGLAGGLGKIGDDVAGGMCCAWIVLFPLATLLVGLFNRVYLVATRGASIGQGVMKLRVVNANGGLLTMGTALVRLLAQAGLCFLPFGALLDLAWPLWDDPTRQTLHDKAVASYVIKTSEGV